MEGANLEAGEKDEYQHEYPASAPCRTRRGGIRVAPSTISPSRAAHRRAGREGTAPDAAPLAFVIENAGNPCPMRVSRQSQDHSGEGNTL